MIRISRVADLVRIPRFHRTTAALSTFVVAESLALFVVGPFWQNALVLTLIAAIAALPLTALFGWARQPILLSGALMLVGAHVASALELHANLLVILLASALSGCVIGVIMSIVLWRLSGLQLFIATLGVSTIAWDAFNLLETSQGMDSGYTLGLPNLFGISFASTRSWLVLCGLICLGGYGYLTYLGKRRFGRSIQLIGFDPQHARVAGVATRRYISAMYGIMGGMTCIAGTLSAYYSNAYSYSTYDLDFSISFVVMIVLGGLGSLGGAIVGAFVVTSAPLVITQYFPSVTASVSSQIPYFENVAYAVIGLAVLMWSRASRAWLAVARDHLVARARGIWGAAGQHRLRDLAQGAQGMDRTVDEDGMALIVDDLAVDYGGGEAGVESARVRLRDGEVLSILGRNGSGKTTLLTAVAGFAPGLGARVRRGAIWLRSSTTGTRANITNWSVKQRVRAGVRLVPAEDKIFPEMTVRAHLREALAAGKRGTGGMESVLRNFSDLVDRLDARAGVLSGGERQQLALACAIASNSSLLLIDEASLGLSPIAISRVSDSLEQVKSLGTASIILVEQSPSLAATVGDVVVNMQDGRTSEAESARGLTAEALAELHGIAAHEGTAKQAARSTTRGDTGPVESMLRMSDVHVTLGSFRILHGATLAVSRGSTTGIIGPNGAGKSSLLNAVCGYYPVSTGSVEFNGVDTTHARMSKMSRLGVRRSFQHVPLVEALTLREYVSLGYEAGRSDFVPLAVIPSPLVERSSRTALREAGEWLGELGLSEFADRAMAETSYAARKLADIARAFMNSPVLVLLDEPTSGVADEHRPVIGNVITQAQSRTGATVVIVDHDVRFISDLVDHMVAMDSGRVIASGEASAVLSDEMVLTSFIGKQSAAKRGPMEAAEVRQSDQ